MPTSEFTDFASVKRKIYQNADKLEKQQNQMYGRINFPNQHRSREVTENEVAKGLHQPNVRHQVSHQTDIFRRLHLLKMKGEGKKSLKEFYKTLKL